MDRQDKGDRGDSRGGGSQGHNQLSSDYYELDRKVAKWAGFTEDDNFVYEPDNTHRNKCAHPYAWPRFTESLDACFKWLVPKLTDAVEQDSIEVRIYCPMAEHSFWLVRITNRQVELGQASEETAPLALCKAIERLIDSG